MMLAIDIGNTRTKLGWFEEGTPLPREEATPTLELAEYLESRVDWSSVSSVGVASVVPMASGGLLGVLDGLGAPRPFVVRPGILLPFDMDYQTPETLGNDRLAAAAGAWMEYGSQGRPVLVLDAGTAVTYEVITGYGRYPGGVIAPGPRLVGRALQSGTAQLPEVSIDVELETAIGRSTAEAIQSGIQWGFVDAVGGMITRLKQEAGEGCMVVATGGWSPFLARHLSGIDILDPHLVLRGIVHLRQLNVG